MTSSRLQALEWIYDRNYIHSRLDALLGHPQIIRIHNKYGMHGPTNNNSNTYQSCTAWDSVSESHVGLLLCCCVKELLCLRIY